MRIFSAYALIAIMLIGAIFVYRRLTFERRAMRKAYRRGREQRRLKMEAAAGSD